MTLVAAIVEKFDTDDETEAVGYVITDQSQANSLVNFRYSNEGAAVLFFTISRRRAKQLCPGLTDEAWKPE